MWERDNGLKDLARVLEESLEYWDIEYAHYEPKLSFKKLDEHLLEHEIDMSLRKDGFDI